MSASKLKHISVSVPYKEEGALVPAGIALLLTILISVPLVIWIMNINEIGIQTANVDKFEQLIVKVDADAKTVDAILHNDAEALARIRADQANQVVTLIVPEVVIVEQNEGAKTVGELRVKIDGIYWSASNPLVGINGDTYRVGDVIQGYEILRIGKSIVQFQSPDGTIVVKDMNASLPGGS